MKLKIAICDDNKIDLDYVSCLLDKWSLKNNILVHKELFASSESFLFNYSENKDYDILLLDIE